MCTVVDDFYGIFSMLTRPEFIKLYFLLWWLKILLMPPTDPGVEFLSLLCGPSGIKDFKENRA